MRICRRTYAWYNMDIIKCLLFVYNFVFALSGIALIAIGLIVQPNAKEFIEFLGSKFVTLVNLDIAVGAIILIVAFLGCCGVLKENYCMVMSFGALLFLIYIINLGGGIAAYMYKNRFGDFVKGNMQESLKQQEKDTHALWDETQIKLKCCGVEGPDDFKRFAKEIPPSCCGFKNPDNATCTEDSPSLNKQGCFSALEDFMTPNIVMVGIGDVGVGLIDLLGVILACCLAKPLSERNPKLYKVFT